MAYSPEEEFISKKLRLDAIEESEFRSSSGVSLEDDKGWAAARKKRLEMDSYTCWYCGFTHPSYMEVHHRAGNWQDDSAENLITLCPVCHSCLHIGLAGVQERGRLLVLSHSCDQAGLNRYIMNTVLKYGPAAPAAVAEIMKNLPVEQDMGDMGLMILANKILKEKSNKRKAPRPIDDKYIFFPNILAYNIVRYIIKNHTAGAAAEAEKNGKRS